MADPDEPGKWFPVLHYDPKATMWTTTSPLQKALLISIALFIILFNAALFRMLYVLQSSRKLIRSRPRPSTATSSSNAPKNPTHLLIVLGSGGHTTEMLSMLSRPGRSLDTSLYTHRTYIISSGDYFSALKASEFEAWLSLRPYKPTAGSEKDAEYSIITIPRARRVHQSLLTTPYTSVKCLWSCISLLRHHFHGYPDLILTNGPGTAVCVILASLILRILGLSGPPRNSKRKSKSKATSTSTSIPDHATPPQEPAPYKNSGQLLTIFIESWARVKTLSLSGKIVLPFVDRFLVQWKALDGEGGRAEYAGPLVA